MYISLKYAIILLIRFFTENQMIFHYNSDEFMNPEEKAYDVIDKKPKIQMDNTNRAQCDPTVSLVLL